jgi:hypothetical protein
MNALNVAALPSMTSEGTGTGAPGTPGVAPDAPG